MKLLKRVSLWAAVLCASTLCVFAAVNVLNQNAKIKITMPDGTVATIEPGQPIPEIPNGAIIEILEGNAEVMVTGDSTVTLVFGTLSAVLDSGDAASAGFNSETNRGFINLVSGSMDVVSSLTNQTTTLNAANPAMEETKPAAPQEPPAGEPPAEETDEEQQVDTDGFQQQVEAEEDQGTISNFE